MAYVMNDGVTLSVKVDIGEMKYFPVYRFPNIKGNFDLATVDDFLEKFQACVPGLIDDAKGVRATISQIIVPSF